MRSFINTPRWRSRSGDVYRRVWASCSSGCCRRCCCCFCCCLLFLSLLNKYLSRLLILNAITLNVLLFVSLLNKYLNRLLILNAKLNFEYATAKVNTEGKLCLFLLLFVEWICSNVVIRVSREKGTGTERHRNRGTGGKSRSRAGERGTQFNFPAQNRAFSVSRSRRPILLTYK